VKRLLKKGDRIRVKVRLMSGWKGTATVTCDQYSREDTVQFIKDGDDPNDWPAGLCLACRHEVLLLRRPVTAQDEEAEHGEG
jgi:hypothetical protein